MVSISQMRHDICRVYDYKPGWLAKVNAMPDNQVAAIWHKFRAQGMDPEVIKKDGSRSVTTLKRAKQHASEAATRKTTYFCTECHEEYVRDNPDLQECEFCGSLLIERI